MPEYLLHKNGRGRLYGDAEANLATYISKDSSARDFAKLRDCVLRGNSLARGSCQVYGGDFLESEICGRTIVAGRPEAFNSILDCSEVSGSPKLLGASLLGMTEVCDSPTIKGMVTCRDATIYGSPVLWGHFTVTGRVHEGTWTRAPKHIKLPWVDLSECINGKMLLNCWCRPVGWWLKFGPQKAREEWDWSEEQIEITIDKIRKEFYTDGREPSITIPANAPQPQEERSVNLHSR